MLKLQHIFIPGNDLLLVLKAILSVNEWDDLGLELGLKKSALDEIHQNKSGIVKDCRKEMVSQWLDTGKATWCGLVQALMSPLVKKRALAVELAKQHKVENTKSMYHSHH